MPAVTRCQHCGGEIREGKEFCPHCGKAVSSGAGGAAQEPGVESSDPPPRVVTAPSFGRPKDEASGSRRVVFVAVAVVAVLLIAGLGYLVTRRTPARPGEERLAGAIRPGSPEFPQSNRLMVEFDPDEDATIGVTGLGTYAVRMAPTVRNFTGRTVNGLEFHAAGLDLKGQTIRERTFVTEDEIEPNKISKPAISLNFPADDRPAQLKLELTGVRFK